VVLVHTNIYIKENLMSYSVADVMSLEKTDLVGSHECVALVQIKAGAPHTSMWAEGEKVRGNLLLRPGTAIATFVNGKYQSHAHGNHAALYIKQDAGGIYLMDQWNDRSAKPKKTTVSSRYIQFFGKDKHGNYNSPSNNGDAFSVIE
jgi:hypothetical protein